MRKPPVLLAAFLINSLIFLGCGEDDAITPQVSKSDPTVNITSPSDGEKFYEGESITFAGSGEDPEDGVLGGNDLVWVSCVDDTIGTGMSFNDSTLSVGIHAITLTATDSDGSSVSAAITIEVMMPQGFVWISADTFTMGSPATEPLRDENETLHLVTLTNDFYMYFKEITNRQYAEMAQWAYNNGYCVATNSSLVDNLDGSTIELLDLDHIDCEIFFVEGKFTVESGKEDYPVFAVTWFGAASYCDWLNLKAGIARSYDHGTWHCNGHDPYNAKGYRLPTEAEWEYACRGGTQTPFYTGDCLDAGTQSNYNGYYPYPDCPYGSDQRWTVPVGSYPPNSFGLFDMHGNMSEWCNDWNGDCSGDEIDPAGPSTGIYRVVRGGDWYRGAEPCRSASRECAVPMQKSIINGFRVCRTFFSN